MKWRGPETGSELIERAPVPASIRSLWSASRSISKQVVAPP